MKSDLERQAPLSPSHAFVVQFRADADIAAAQVAGRVEHVVSGRARPFDSVEALLAFCREVLRDVRQQPCQSGPEERA